MLSELHVLHDSAERRFVIENGVYWADIFLNYQLSNLTEVFKLDGRTDIASNASFLVDQRHGGRRLGVGSRKLTMGRDSIKCKIRLMLDVIMEERVFIKLVMVLTRTTYGQIGHSICDDVQV